MQPCAASLFECPFCVYCVCRGKLSAAVDSANSLCRLARTLLSSLNSINIVHIVFYAALECPTFEERKGVLFWHFLNCFMSWKLYFLNSAPINQLTGGIIGKLHFQKAVYMKVILAEHRQPVSAEYPPCILRTDYWFYSQMSIKLLLGKICWHILNCSPSIIFVYFYTRARKSWGQRCVNDIRMLVGHCVIIYLTYLMILQ